jgi:cytochrome c-type biogenesis protein CcmF
MLATISSLILGIFYIVKPGSINKNLNNFLYIILLTLFSSFILLIYAFVISDFTVLNVYANSSINKPLIYKISASWASHEGSMLLWMTLLSLITTFFIYECQKNDSSLLKIILNRALGIQFILIATFLSFVLFSSNPFTASEYVTEGKGLNPVLQDLGLAIHPPLLYLGYVTYSVPFSIFLSLLIGKALTNNNIPLSQEKLEKELLIDVLKFTKKYSLIGWTALSAGVSLGSWWAYRVLGWGGFWFFDPVENISLMPWLAGTAFHHYIFATIKRNVLTASTLLFGLITFLLCFLGTFLVRSGIITSVHTFAVDMYRGSIILALFGVFSIISLSLYATQVHKFNSENITNLITREGGILIGNLSLLISLIILLIGTFYPLFIELTQGKKLSLNSDFYIKLFIPSILPSITLSAFLGFSAWSQNDNKKMIKKSLIHILISIIFTIIFFNYSKSILGGTCLFFGLYTSSYCLFELIDKRKTASIGRISMTIAHLGIGLILITYTLYASFEQEIELSGKINDKYNFKGFNITYQNIIYSAGQNYYRQILKLGVEDNKGNELTILTPEIRYFTTENSMLSSASIYSTLFYDLYAVITQIKNENIKAKIYYRPAASMFLFSCFVMVTGGLISLFCKRKKPNIILKS